MTTTTTAATPDDPDREPGRRLLRVRDVKDRLRVCERTVRGWIAAGRLSVVRLSTRAIRIEETELERFLDERRDVGAA